MTDVTPTSEDWCELARSKLLRVFGPQEAELLMRLALQDAGLKSLNSADDLHCFANHLSARGGFASAVGALLALQAVLRGASRR